MRIAGIPLLVLLLFVDGKPSECERLTAFVPASRALSVSRRNRLVEDTASHLFVSTTNVGLGDDNDDDDLDGMRRQVQRMRKEAIQRIEHLTLRMDEVRTATAVRDAPPGPSPSETPLMHLESSVGETESRVDAPSKPNRRRKEEDVDSRLDRMLRRIRTGGESAEPVKSATTTAGAVSHSTGEKHRPSQSVEQRKQDKIDTTHLLDGTRWKVMLNVGREQGTWMPKTWGVSGERLLMSLEVDFSSDQLFEREEFLAGGLAGARRLNVVGNEITLGPSMTEGSRTYAVRGGGWKIGRGDGPAGTDVLRFFFDVDDEVRHHQGDVYCPAGRVYLTCGYFPIHHSTSERTPLQEIEEELQEAEASLNALDEELERDWQAAPLWDRLGKVMELYKANSNLSRIAKLHKVEKIREPDRSLLRLSRKGDVGLTRDGGICCKVVTGLSVEYHILGKFYMASIEPKE